MYAAFPSDVTEPADGAIWSAVVGDLGMPDIYADDILNMILYRAYSKDSEYAGNTERAASYLNAVVASLGAEISATMAVKPQSEPSA